MKNNSRFTAGLGTLKEAGGKAAPVATMPQPAATEGQGGNAPAAKAQQASRAGKVAIAAYFDPVVRKQLAILSVEQDTSQAALLAEALNMLFEKHGRPPIAKA